MTDRISKEHRSWNMSRIKSKHSKPELIVRRLLHNMGYRFRLHVNSLPCKPDIVLKKYKTILFIHGCFWHRHSKCKNGHYLPKDPRQGIEFWRDKFEKNIQRDKKNRKNLEKLGWKVAVIWECQTEDIKKLKKKINSIFVS